MLRYVAFVWDSLDEAQQVRARVLCSRVEQGASGMRRALCGSGLQVFCATDKLGSGKPCMLPDSSGVIIGTMFRRDGSSRVDEISRNDHVAITANCGRGLIENFWGRYVAFIHSSTDGVTRVIKDPTGRLPCFTTTLDGIQVFFSSIGDCSRLGLPELPINWAYIRNRVVRGPAQVEGTALQGIREVLGGECVEFRKGEPKGHTYWNPIDIAELRTIESEGEAIESIRETTRQCVRAWAGCFDGVLHRLSGGLDSSIVFSCLADRSISCRTTCVTWYSQNGIADERPWARLVTAGHPTIEHIERPLNDQISLNQLLRLAPSVNPTPHLAYLEYSRIEQQIAREKGASAVLDGEGGDSLFGRLSKQVAAIDYVQKHGLRPSLLAHAESTALVTNSSVWSVLGQAARSAFTRYSPAALLGDNHRELASSKAQSAVEGDVEALHPWFRSSGRPRPGVMRSLLLIAFPAIFYDPLFNPEEQQLEHVSPLTSQPLVELCIRIPSYVHIQGARDRAIARKAFSSSLPERIASRQWKDRSPGFREELLQRNIKFVREMLLDGILVSKQLLERERVERVLDGAPAHSSVYAMEIFDHLITETWLRRMTGFELRAAA